MTNGAGNYATWLHRFHRYTRYGTQLAPTSGSMGYGLPAAVGAKRVHPDKTVVCFAGDGCFLMRPGIRHRRAIRPAHHRGAGRQRHVRHHPHAPGKTLSRPRFRHRAQEPRLRRLRARFGGHGERVESSEQFGPAFERALASGKPAILHCLIDPETISPSTTLARIRDAALQAKS